jgi:hypothetical protein
MPFRHEKSRRKKISSRFVTKTHKPDLHDAVSSRKKPPQRLIIDYVVVVWVVQNVVDETQCIAPLRPPTTTDN